MSNERKHIRRTAVTVFSLVTLMLMVQAYSRIERHQALLGLEDLLSTIEDLLDDQRSVEELDPLLATRFEEKLEDIQTALEVGDIEGAISSANWLGSYSRQPYVGGETTLDMYRMWLTARTIRSEMIDPLLSHSTTPSSMRTALEDVEATLLEIEDASVDGFPADIDFTFCATRMLTAVDLVQAYAGKGVLPSSFERHFVSRAEEAVRRSSLSISTEVTDPAKFGDLVFLSDDEIADIDAWIGEGIELAAAGDTVGAVESYIYALALVEDQLDAVRSPLPLEFRTDLGNHVLAFETELLEASRDWWPSERTPAIGLATDQLVQVVLAKDELNGLVQEVDAHDPSLSAAVTLANEHAKELAFDERGDEVSSMYSSLQIQVGNHRSIPEDLKGELLDSLDAYAEAITNLSNTYQTLIAPDDAQSCGGDVDTGPDDPEGGLWPNTCCSTMGHGHGHCIGAQDKSCKMQILNWDPPNGEMGCMYAPDTFECD